MSIRKRLSSALNSLLNRMGYAFVRADGSRNATVFSVHEGERYAYEWVLIGDGYAPWALNEDFLETYEAIRNHTLVDIYRCYELYQLVGEVSSIEGDIVEVGVWRGGTGAILAASAERKKPEANVWLCDTFRGVAKAGRFDAWYRGGEHGDTSAQLVADLMRSLSLSHWDLLEGIFPEETAFRIGDRKIALCHIDVDVYQSASDTVCWLLPRMPSGGVVVFDDYGYSTCKGITRLVEQLRGSGDWIVLHNLNKHAVLIRR